MLWCRACCISAINDPRSWSSSFSRRAFFWFFFFALSLQRLVKPRRRENTCAHVRQVQKACICNVGSREARKGVHKSCGSTQRPTKKQRKGALWTVHTTILFIFWQGRKAGPPHRSLMWCGARVPKTEERCGSIYLTVPFHIVSIQGGRLVVPIVGFGDSIENSGGLKDLGHKWATRVHCLAVLGITFLYDTWAPLLYGPHSHS